ncbi:MAG: ATP-binding cassette domain-containing protein [Nitrososphaerales archaeon]|nr:ATP-binding cassette domain-containing protein [Nitrososphaerales archaeon]
MKLKVLLEREPRKIFRVNKSFQTKSIITDRTMAVAEAFGIGLDTRRFPVFKNFAVDINPRDLVYITGESGSGKSVLSRELVKQIKVYKDVFGEAITDKDLKIDPHEVLVHGAGPSTEEALRNLSMAGLNEAFLFLRRYRELSDGQKYRYKISKMLASGADVWVMDKFCATLDREMAKVVAFCLQKVARKKGKTVLVATTHTDLFEDLGPSVFIEKSFGEDVKVTYLNEDAPKECSIVRGIRIVQASRTDYGPLGRFHYRSGLPPSLKVFQMVLGDRTIGVIVYTPSRRKYFGRSIYLGRSFPLEEVNRNFACISRVIIHSRYRSIGLGTKLVRETLALAGKKYVEAIAVMAKYAPFFEKAGMTEVPEALERRGKKYYIWVKNSKDHN